MWTWSRNGVTTPSLLKWTKRPVDLGRFELPTPSLQMKCSNQLSHRPRKLNVLLNNHKKTCLFGRLAEGSMPSANSTFLTLPSFGNPPLVLFEYVEFSP